MTSDPAYIREHKKAEREADARVALLRKIVNTYGFALLGAAFTDPVLKNEPMTLINFLMAGFALALHVLAIYLAPIGKESSDD